jgi:hypothetical protein
MLKKVEKNKSEKRFTELSDEEHNEIIKKAIIASNRDQLEVMNSKTDLKEGKYKKCDDAESAMDFLNN